MTSIRIAGADDASALHAVAAATFRLACPPGTSEADMASFIDANLSEERMTDYLAATDRRLFLAYSAGAPVGYTMLVLGEPADADAAAAVTTRPTAELSKCYLLADQHGSGAASRLVEATIDEARRRGAASVWLGVNQHNARANAFYAKCGFEVVGTKHFLVGEHVHDDFVRERVVSTGAQRVVSTGAHARD